MSSVHRLAEDVPRDVSFSRQCPFALNAVSFAPPRVGLVTPPLLGMPSDRRTRSSPRRSCARLRVPGSKRRAATTRSIAAKAASAIAVAAARVSRRAAVPVAAFPRAHLLRRRREGDGGAHRPIHRDAVHLVSERDGGFVPEGHAHRVVQRRHDETRAETVSEQVPRARLRSSARDVVPLRAAQRLARRRDVRHRRAFGEAEELRRVVEVFSRQETTAKRRQIRTPDAATRVRAKPPRPR